MNWACYWISSVVMLFWEFYQIPIGSFELIELGFWEDLVMEEVQEQQQSQSIGTHQFLAFLAQFLWIWQLQFVIGTPFLHIVMKLWNRYRTIMEILGAILWISGQLWNWDDQCMLSDLRTINDKTKL